MATAAALLLVAAGRLRPFFVAWRRSPVLARVARGLSNQSRTPQADRARKNTE